MKKLSNFFSNKDIFGFYKIKFWNKFFIIIFSTIIWLCMLSIFSSIQLERIVNPLKFASKNSILIEIHPENTKNKTNMKAEIVLDFLSKQPYVTSYQRISDEKIIELINSFTVQKDKSLSSIPLPILISVEVSSTYQSAVGELKIELSQKVNNIYLDTETELLKRLVSPLNTTKYISFAIPFLVLILLSGILFLIIYAILFSNKSFIRTLILLGIYKNTLYKELGKWILLRSLQSCFIAIVLSFITLLIIYLFNISAIDAMIQYLDVVLLFMLITPIISSILGIIFVRNLVSKHFYTNE